MWREFRVMQTHVIIWILDESVNEKLLDGREKYNNSESGDLRGSVISTLKGACIRRVSATLNGIIDGARRSRVSLFVRFSKSRI